MRRDQKDDEYVPLFPDAGLDYLLGYFYEVGPAIKGGPITHSEVDSWQRQVGIELEPWEVRALRRLSRDYLNESHRAEKPDAKAPWEPPADPIEMQKRKAAQAMRMRESVRRMAAT